MYEIAVKERTVLDEAMALATVETCHSKSHLDALLNVKRALLPIEQKAAEDLDEKLLQARQDVHQKKIGLPRLSFEPLTWRHKSGLPKIVPMSLDNPEFRLGAYRGEFSSVTEYVEPMLPASIRECFNDVTGGAAEYCYRQRSKMEYSFTFEGMIPDSTRLKIGDALQERSFESIYLLVETPDTSWQIKRTKGLTRRQVMREAMANLAIDPIVVGFKYDAFWVIDKFDLTNVEQYVLDEFSHLALPSGE